MHSEFLVLCWLPYDSGLYNLELGRKNVRRRSGYQYVLKPFCIWVRRLEDSRRLLLSFVHGWVSGIQLRCHPSEMAQSCESTRMWVRILSTQGKAGCGCTCRLALGNRQWTPGTCWTARIASSGSQKQDGKWLKKTPSPTSASSRHWGEKWLPQCNPVFPRLSWINRSYL